MLYLNIDFVSLSRLSRRMVSPPLLVKTYHQRVGPTIYISHGMQVMMIGFLSITSFTLMRPYDCGNIRHLSCWTTLQCYRFRKNWLLPLHKRLVWHIQHCQLNNILLIAVELSIGPLIIYVDVIEQLNENQWNEKEYHATKMIGAGTNVETFE